MSRHRNTLFDILTSPRVILALGVVTIGGSAAGMAIGASPMVMRGIGGAFPERIVPSAGATMPDAAEGPADHYPLVTPNGTIPVAELALRGRLRHTRGWTNDHDEEFAFDGGLPDQYSLEELDDLARWHPDRSRSSSRAADHREPAQLALAVTEPDHSSQSVEPAVARPIVTPRPVESGEVATSSPAAPSLGENGGASAMETH